MPNTRTQGGGQGQRNGQAVVMRNLWYLSEGKPALMRVQTGITDGSSTEIQTRGADAANTSGENLDGRQIILREKINAGN